MKRICISMIVLALAACGPKYETQYLLVEPASAEGKTCAAECQKTADQCNESCRMYESYCDTSVRLEGSRVVLGNVNTRFPSASESHQSRYCAEKIKCEHQCADNHHLCHRRCGGQVEQHTVCVRNCES